MSSFSTPTKHESITELLAERISQGAYLHGQLPGERALAIELGVSYLTVRKATKQLLKDGLLARTPKGRLMPCASQESQKRGPQIGLLVDTIPEVSMSAWLNDLDAVVKAKNGTLRLISYSHETDPRVFEALDAELDGLVIVYRYELSPLLRDRLIQNRHRVVSLWFDIFGRRWLANHSKHWNRESKIKQTVKQTMAFKKTGRAHIVRQQFVAMNK